MTVRIVLVRADEDAGGPVTRMHRAAREAAGRAVALVLDGVDAADVVVVHDDRGRPSAHAAGPDGPRPLEVGLSLSHAAGWGAALAWADDD